MKQLKCEMCNSVDLIKQDGLFVCQCCGCKYSVEEAKKLMVDGTVEVEGTVKVDTSEELANLYQIARKAKDDGNSENAQKYYEMILIKDPSSWEANFYSVYFQTANCTVAKIANAAFRLRKQEESVLEMVKESIEDEQERRKIVKEIGSRLIALTNALSSSATSSYEGIAPSIQDRHKTEYRDRIRECRDIMYTYGDLLERLFQSEYSDVSVACWKVGIPLGIKVGQIAGSSKSDISSFIEKYVEKIQKYDSTYEVPEFSGGGCYVATCVYGSYDCPEVWTLRRFRDNTLAETWYGRAFIHTYYAISPTLVKWFGETAWFKKMWKGKLDKMVSNLRANGVEDTPYQDKEWK